MLKIWSPQNICKKKIEEIILMKTNFVHENLKTKNNLPIKFLPAKQDRWCSQTCLKFCINVI